nr:Holliday junction resolvase (Rus) [uncultured Mediterranean phage uvMED]
MEKLNESPQPLTGPQDSLIEFWVEGIPRPQGSKRHVGNGRMVEASKHTAGWRKAVSQAALAAFTGEPISGPVGVAVHFLFPRPKSHYRTGRNAEMLRQGAPKFPTTRAVGDIDKLARALCDAVSVTSGGSVLQDDSLVQWLYGQKEWAARNEASGAYVRIMKIC